MNLALVIQHRALAAIQQWFGARSSAAAQAPQRPQHVPSPVPLSRQRPLGMPPYNAPFQAAASVASVPANKPLRVVRVVESGQTRSSSGRMVISGRMADVCAELDRLVAREAALH